MFLVRSGSIHGYDNLIRELGGNPVQLTREAGLSPAQFRNPNTYVSYSRLAELLERAAQACAQPRFGLLLSRRQSSTVLGDLPLLMSRHTTAGEALAATSKYLYLHARGVELRQVPAGEQVRLELVFEISSPLGLNQLIQLSIGHLANFATEVFGLEKYSLPLQLRQPAPAVESAPSVSATYPRVTFDANSDCVQVPAQWLERRSRQDDQALRQHLQGYLQQLQQRYPDNLPDQVREIAGRILPSGECTLERVATTLELHPRVLQKRLKRLGTSYGDLLQQTRQAIAEQHLRHGSMSVTDLALNLGYADVAVFSRHFKQWTGLSPRHWRDTLPRS